MTADIWERLYSTLTILPDRTTPSYIPSLKSFELFESVYGVKLPESYRTFAFRFGAGWLGGFFRMAVPDYPEDVVWFDLHRLNQQSVRSFPPDYIAEIHCSSVPPDEVQEVVKQIQRMMFFCSLEGEEYIGWDPIDASDAGPNEYGIFILPRMKAPVYCGCSFVQFVLDICLGDKFPDYAPVERESWIKEDRQLFIRE